jgi:hypothetical protein
VTFRGSHIISFKFAQEWPRARFRLGRHFMDERFIIDSVPMAPWLADAGKDRREKTFKTVRASDALQHAKPFWHRYFGSISAELETIRSIRSTTRSMQGPKGQLRHLLGGFRQGNGEDGTAGSYPQGLRPCLFRQR